MKITTNEAAQLIRGSKGKLFRITFEKRKAPGAIRHMTARVGVWNPRYVKGEGQKFNPADHNLLTVFEFVREPATVRDERGRFAGSGNMACQWRSLGIERIRRLKMNGEVFEVA